MDKNITSVSLIFDDGFVKSCLRISDIFEARGLRATFAVLVDHEGFMPDFPKGDFKLWNRLQYRGHVIHPHGYDHTDLSKVPLETAKTEIDSCLDSFSSNLENFNPKKTVYHLAYNRSSPQIEDYLLTKVRAIRTTGPDGNVGSGMNGKTELERGIYNCSWHGPEHCDGHLMSILKIAETKRPELMMYMMHGLEDEGWGPIHADALEEALDYIIKSSVLTYTDL